MKQKIESVLEKIQPHIRFHGGDVKFIDFKDGILKLRISGACVGCPLADLTYNKMVAGILKKEIPEIKEIIFIQ